MPDRTLKLTLPLGKTLIGALLILAAWVSVAEILARQPVIQSWLPAPSLGSGHYEFEYELMAAQWLRGTAGNIDCLFLGSSMPDLGIDPAEFEQAYLQTTGHPIVCYNFGLNLADAYDVGAIAPILVEELKPKLLIYGTTARDYNSPALPAGKPDPIVDTPWVQYRLGHWSMPGWLIEHFYSYRYFLRFANYSSLASQTLADLEVARGDYGYNPHPGQDPQFNPNVKQTVHYWNYQVLPHNLKGLQQFLALQTKGVQIVVVEMPIHPLHLQVFSNGIASYDLFLNAVDEAARSRNIPFWRMSEQDPIPTNGWWNANHLNTVGAKAFSQWLGRRVGTAVRTQSLRDPTTPSP